MQRPLNGALNPFISFDSLVQDITPEEEAYRIANYYEPYHSTISTYIDSPAEPIDFVFSIHSFTSCYEGQIRQVEVGVLYKDDCDEPIALRLHDTLLKRGFAARINEPWYVFN